MTGDRRLLALLAALCALAINACGKDDADPTASATTTAAPAAKQDPGAFPDKPQILLRFAARPEDWPAQVRKGGSEAGYAAGRYRLTGTGTAFRVALPRPIEPAARGVLLETTLRLTRSGRAGLFCRGSEDGRSGYELTVDRSGHWEITRVEDGVGKPVGDGEVGAEAVGGKSGDALVRLICGAAEVGKPLSLGFTIGAREVEFVRDEQALAPASTSRVGLVVRTSAQAAAQASFEYFAASLAE